ncbi:hypothetical protein [Streptomyces avermitilis]|uniref:hypothetical protein n=1 Tax=Streptomyces avermitilis TaxID=33903 RepID=UPI0037199C93
MTSGIAQLPGAQDGAARDVLRAHGYQVGDIQALARNQDPFAVRVPRRKATIAPGMVFQARTVELGGGCFTNVFTLTCDLDQVAVKVVSAVDGFHLRDLIPATAQAAVSGSFSFISDDPVYQPAEPSLDFACRGGQVMSLPTASKSAFLVHRGMPSIRTLLTAGTLNAAGRTYRWSGSKARHSHACLEPGELTVFGASNCRIRYSDHPRTGFTRDVDQSTNITPPDPSAIDYVVTWSPQGGHRVASVHPGGGADLFAGNFILRAGACGARDLQEGTKVAITQVAGADAEHLDCGVSLGPSVADAAAGLTSAYDECLGTSPFRETRTARTLIGLSERQLTFQVLDGAPLTAAFRGATPKETAALCTLAGFDPRSIYHLDGGQSSKIAFTEKAETQVVGSMHYLQWPHSPTEPFRWQGLHGRILRNAFAIRSNQPEGAQ